MCLKCKWYHYLTTNHEEINDASSVQPPFLVAQVTQRIVAMYQKGDLDPAVAMQLLGQAHTAKKSTSDTEGDSKKRPLEDHDATGEGDGPSLDDILQQAKRAKNDSLLFRVYLFCGWIWSVP